MKFEQAWQVWTIKIFKILKEVPFFSLDLSWIVHKFFLRVFPFSWNFPTLIRARVRAQAPILHRGMKSNLTFHSGQMSAHA